MTAPTSLRQRALAALGDGRPRSLAVLSQALGMADRNAVSSAVTRLVSDGQAQRIGPAPSSPRHDRRLIEITEHGRKVLADIEAAAKREPAPPSRLRSLPLLMVARGGVERRDDCVHYEECLDAAALRLPQAAQCPRVCPSYAARTVSAVAFTSSGRSNGESAIFTGAWAS